MIAGATGLVFRASVPQGHCMKLGVRYEANCDAGATGRCWPNWDVHEDWTGRGLFAAVVLSSSSSVLSYGVLSRRTSSVMTTPIGQYLERSALSVVLSTPYFVPVLGRYSWMRDSSLP